MMGWANCGEDRSGRPIGYAYEATCDHPGCHNQIDRGLSYACGDMHGNDEIGCDGYFCERHRATHIEHDGKHHQICNRCATELVDSEEWQEDENEGCLRKLDE